jgi:hypothetical protein
MLDYLLKQKNLLPAKEKEQVTGYLVGNEFFSQDWNARYLEKLILSRDFEKQNPI